MAAGAGRSGRGSPTGTGTILVASSRNRRRRRFLFRNGKDGRALTLIEGQQLISSSVVSAAARRCSWTCDDVVMSTAELAAYSPGDQEGFASLVNDTHAEYGFSYHPVLDKDLADPVASYSHVWVLISEGSVVGSVTLTVPLNGTTTLKRMYVRPHFRGEGWGAPTTGHCYPDGCERGLSPDQARYERPTSPGRAPVRSCRFCVTAPGCGEPLLREDARLR